LTSSEIVASPAALVALTTMDGQMSHTSAEGEALSVRVILKVSNEVVEGSSSADRWKLPVVTDKDEPTTAIKSIEERREHVLGEHG